MVGTSGCGKSTIVQLIQRFYDLSAGKLNLDDHNIQQLNMPDITSPPPGYSHKHPHNRPQQSVTSSYVKHNAQQQQHNRQLINRSQHTRIPHGQSSSPSPRPYIFSRPNQVPYFVTEPNREPLSVKNRFSPLSHHQNNLN